MPRQWENELVDNATPIEVLNPIASELEVNAFKFTAKSLNVLRQNVGRHNAAGAGFELSHVFIRDTAVENTDTTVKRHCPAPLRSRADLW